jgi:hypothetical protein
MAGDVDIIPAVPPDDIDRINRSGKAKVASIPGNRIVFFALDCRSKPFDNKLVRQAVNYGANIDHIIRTVLKGNGTRVATILNPWYVGYEDEVKPIPYDPEKAKALLRQAGYPQGAEFTFYGTQGRISKDKEVIKAIVNELARSASRQPEMADWEPPSRRPAPGNSSIWFRSWGLHADKLSLFNLQYRPTPGLADFTERTTDKILRRPHDHGPGEGQAGTEAQKICDDCRGCGPTPFRTSTPSAPGSVDTAGRRKSCAEMVVTEVGPVIRG